MNSSKTFKPSQEMSDIADEIEAAYWVPILRTPFEGLDEIQERSKTDCPELHQAFAAFNANMHAAKEFLEFPYFLLLPYLTDVRDHIASSPSLLNDSVEDAVEEQLTIDLVTVALKASRGPLLRNKAQLQRLLHQACILIWNALETFSKQVFIAALNQKPSLYNAICKNPEMRERLSIANSNWANLLQSHDFDLTGKLGTIIAANRDFSSPQLLRTIFPVMLAEVGTIGFGKSDEDDKTLWTLGQRRHLIAHRCGVVDQDYLNKTHDDTQQFGMLLNLRGRDLGSAMGAAARFAILLYGNARYCWR
jgi:hypothetical protein